MDVKLDNLSANVFAHLCIGELSFFPTQDLPYVTVVCTVQERLWKSEAPRTYSTAVTSMQGVTQMDTGTFNQFGWTVHMFSLMVLYFAPPFLTREETFHNESGSYHIIGNYKGAIKLWLLWVVCVFSHCNCMYECEGINYMFQLNITFNFIIV